MCWDGKGFLACSSAGMTKSRRFPFGNRAAKELLSNAATPGAGFDGSYSGTFPDSNGCIHVESDTITDGKLSGQQSFCSNDPSIQGAFDLSGVVTPIDATSASVAGEVTINNAGVRTAPFTGGISIDSSGDKAFSWTATDPLFGGIGGGATSPS
jgi:hypothetical protein